jgi:hypothetical protein
MYVATSEYSIVVSFDSDCITLAMLVCHGIAGEKGETLRDFSKFFGILSSGLPSQLVFHVGYSDLQLNSPLDSRSIIFMETQIYTA